MKFQKGHKINLGRKLPEQWKINIGKAQKGKHRVWTNGHPRGMLGKIPWNKGLTKDTNENIRIGAKKTSETRIKRGLGRGILSGNWKGEDAKYHTKHTWLRNNFGKANKCENKSCLERSNNYQWANVSGKYKRTREDYIQLCIRCHKIYDGFKRKFKL